MGNKNTKFFDDLSKGATWSAGVAFKRSNPLPLDRYSVFETKALAEAYATSNAVAYPGQVIAVAEGNKMVAYVLAENTAGDALVLQQIGIIPTGDDKTIDVTEDGVISLLAADTEVFKKDAEGNPTEEKEINAGAQLVLQADGTLKWVKPDTTTVEGLSIAVKSLETTIGKPVDGENDATGLFKDIDDEAKARADADAKLSARIGYASEEAKGEEGSEDYKPAVEASGVYVAIEAEVARAKAAEKELDDAIKAIDFIDADELATELAPYAKTTDVNKTLEDYATIEYVDGEIDKIEDAISKLNHFTTKIVTSINEVTEEGVLYLIKDETVAGVDKYNEYLYVGGEAVLIGDTTTDLSDYYTKGQVDGIIDALNIEDYAKQADLNEASGKITVLEGKVDVEKVSTAIAAAESRAATDAQSKANKALEDAKADTDTKLANYYKKTETYSQTEVNELIKDFATDKEVEDAVAAEAARADKAEKANADAITAIKADASIVTFKGVEEALASKQATGDYATKAEAKGYADAKDTAISAAQGKADSAYALAEGAQSAAEAAQSTANTNTANINSIENAIYGRVITENEDYPETVDTGIIGDLANARTRLASAEGTLSSIVDGTSSVPKATEADTLDGKHAIDFDAAGAAAQALADAKTWVGEQDYSTNASVKALEDRIKAEEDKADNDTTYTFEDGTEGTFKVTAKGGAAQTVNTGAKDYIDGKVVTINGELDKKAVKSEVEEALDLKADVSSVYTKEEVNTTLADYAKTADVPSIKVNAAATADKVTNSLTVGKKTFDGSAAVEVTAADLGLESAMHFIGAFASAPASGKNGDVYLNTNTSKEYVYSDNNWIELGDEGSYALRTVTVTGVDGLTGGGDLTDNRTIGIADNGVVTAKIADKNVTKAKLAEDVQTSLGKADSALQASDIGTMAKEAASDYVKKTDASGYDDILTKTVAATTYQPVGNYATAEQGAKADTAIQSVTSLHDAIVVTPGENGAITINFADEIILNGGGANVAAE